jgi:hypothetical protein
MGVTVEDLGTGYSLPKTAFRVALRLGPLASKEDFHRVKRAAARQLDRVVRKAGLRPGSGDLLERWYESEGRPVWELAWAPKGAAGRRGMADPGRDPGAAGGDAAPSGEVAHG